MRPILLVALLIAASPVHGEEDSWRKLPYPPGRADRVSGIALEGETLWAMFQNVVYWDGMKWRKPEGPALRGGMYLTQFLGGGSQPLYCTQPSERDNVGKLLKLSAGAAEPILEFPFDRPTDPPGIFVSRKGTIVNLTQGKFSVYDDDQWIDFLAPEKGSHLVFDRGEKVDVYYPLGHKLFTVGPRNQVKQREIKLPFEPRFSLRGARWGEHSALLFEHGLAKSPVTLDLETGEIAATKVPDLSYYDAFAMLDGATLLLARGEQGMHLCNLGPKGDFSEVPESRGIRWDTEHFRPPGIVEGPKGEVWIGGIGHPILRFAILSDGKPPKPDNAAVENAAELTRQFGPETGLDLMDCRQLAIDSRGNLFAASARGIYERFAADPPERPASPRRPQPLGQALWQWKPKQARIRAAWNVGDSLVLASSDAQITSLSARGEVRFQARIEGDAVQPPWLVKSTDKNRVKVGSPKGITSLDAETGKLLDLLPVQFDARIAPKPIEGGHLIVRRGRSQAIEAVDDAGKKRWKTELPGYVHAHPTTHGNLAIVQTRTGSYGGQATVCIDTREGKILWQDVTDAYGVGAAFARSGELVVEADQKMSPELTNGWLICREIATGKRLWDYRVDGLIHHPPMVDATDELVFAVFSRGEVVCLNAEDGRLVWKRRLPDNALEGVALSYDAAWSPHSIQDDRLLVVDCNHVLHVIRRFSGKIHAEILLSSSPGEKLVGAPWIAGDMLVVPLTTGVSAYRWPPALP